MSGEACSVCILRYINGSRDFINIASHLVGVTVDPDCSECSSVEIAHLRMCTDCLSYDEQRPQLCPHGFRMRASEPIRIKDSA